METLFFWNYIQRNINLLNRRQVGIDEDVLSTGITLYHLKEGQTRIGSDGDGPGPAPDIHLRGPCIFRDHCVIDLVPILFISVSSEKLSNLYPRYMDTLLYS
jgi:hypothetical protein